MKIVEKIMYVLAAVGCIMVFLGLFVALFIIPLEDFPKWLEGIAAASVIIPFVYDQYKMWQYEQMKKKRRKRRGRY